MTLDQSPEQTTLRNLACEVAKPFAARAREYEDASQFPAENFKELRDAGFLKLTVPKEYGGKGLWGPGGHVSYYLVLEEVARHCSSTAQLLQVHCHATGVLSGLATKAQKDHYLPQIVEDGKLLSSAGSEASVKKPGPDAIDTVLSKRGSGYVLNGRKAFASLSGAADYYLVWAMLEGKPAAADGLLHIMVPKGAPGVTLIDDWDAMGMRATVTWSLEFKDAPIQPSQVVSNPGDWVRKDFRSFTLGHAANHLGTAQNALDFVVDYVRKRDDLIQNASIRCHIADMDAALNGARSLLYDAAVFFEREEFARAELTALRAFYLSKQAAVMVATKAFHVCGARSIFNQFPLPRIYNNIRTYTMHTRDETILNLVGEAMLKEQFHPKQAWGGRVELAGA